jgi:DNA replication and repair protein RecF
MFVKNLFLLNYRNYNELKIDFSKNVNVFVGDNAQGKTNILEAIYYCAFAKSHRTSKDKELVNWAESSAYINLNVGRARIDKRIDINILSNGKKAISVNSIKIKKIGELFGNFNVVMFSPEDLKIIKESPGIRRRFLDMEICQINNKYYYNLVKYNKVLNERNIVLKNKNLSNDMLDIYDQQIVLYGEYIINKRLEYLSKLNFYGKNIHNDITQQKENIEFKYLSTIKNLDEVKDSFSFLLKNSRKKDFERGITTIGPHRDDFSVYINEIDTKSYGSQGQQRTAVLTIKFSSLSIIKEFTGEYPVLLLDDVLSELDFNRKKYVLSSIGDIQTMITCTGDNDIKSYLDSSSKIFTVSNGVVSN